MSPARPAKACERFTTKPPSWTLQNETVTPEGLLRISTTNPGPTCIGTWAPSVKPAAEELWVAFDVRVDEAVADPQSAFFEGFFEMSISGGQSVSVALSSTLDGSGLQLVIGAVSKSGGGSVGQEATTVAVASGKLVPVFIHLGSGARVEAWADGVKATNERFAVEWSPEPFSDFRFVAGLSPALNSSMKKATLHIDNLRFDD